MLLCTFNCFATNLKRQLTAGNNEHKDTATTDRTVEQSSDRKKRKLLSNFRKKLLITFNVFNCKTKLCYNCCCECYINIIYLPMDFILFFASGKTAFESTPYRSMLVLFDVNVANKRATPFSFGSSITPALHLQTLNIRYNINNK